MSTTTEILFNSPALHSLKREQLVKLCKIHSIKASGKNVDLIHKLRLHAQTLPKDSPLSIAARSEEHGPIPMQLQSPENDEKQTDQEMSDDASYQSTRPPRPSEQWEMVMDSIEELEEEGSSQGTLTSMRTASQGGGTGEFGTGGSRSTTVSSSIKAIATSLGLKRGNAKSTPASSLSTSSSSFIMPKNPSHPVHEAPDQLSQISTPYSSLPESSSLPQTDHFTLNNMDTRMSIGGSTEVPLPGTVLRPGVPAPANARLSMGLNGPSTPTRPTTTIRLISNPLSNLDPTNNTTNTDRSYDNYGGGENGTPQLKPFHTTFDITFGSPAPLPLATSSFGGAFNFGSLATWPPRSEEDEDVQMTGLYPKLSLSDLPPSIEPKLPGTPSKPGDGGVHPRPNSHSHSLATSGLHSPDLFVFGTPHKVTDDQFRSAAASVLEDLNRQLREDGVEELGEDIIAKLHPAVSKAKARKESLAQREIRPLPGAKRAAGEITDKFQKMHEDEFEKMEGIDSVVRKKNERMESQSHRGRKALDDGEGQVNEDMEKPKVVVGKKRKSSVVAEGKAREGPRRPSGFAPRRASNTRVISNGRRAKALPGAFGLDDDDDDDDDNEAEEEEGRSGKRVRVDRESSGDGDGAPSPSPEEQEREKRRLELEREKDAIRKKLESNRARRRSSAAHGGLSARKSGRVSVGRPRPSVLVKPKPKPSRFGFLSSAKSLVQSVWNRGKAPPAAAGPSQIPKPTMTIPTAATATTKPEAPKTKDKMGPPMLLSKKRASVAPARPTHLVASGSGSGSRVVSGTTLSSVASASSSTRSRSPLPSTFMGAGSGTGASSSRNSLQSNVGTRTGTRSRTLSSNVSSLGTRVSTTSHPNASTNNRVSNIGSMGTKNQNVSGAAGAGNRSSVASRSSRLYAPTASSLAKMTRSTPVGHQRTGSGSGSGSEHLQKQTTATGTTLGSITNSPTVVARSLPSSSSSHPHSPAMSQSSTLFSPRQQQQQQHHQEQGHGRIFSKPLLLPVTTQPSGIPIPTPVKRKLGNGNENGNDDVNVNDTPRAKEDQVQAKPSAFVRTHSLNGRKPRISRSKVIAKLASQRREAGGGSGGGSGARASGSTHLGAGGIAPGIAPSRKSAGKNRSSLGAKVSSRGRASGGLGGGGAVAMSAKKRARQSEYARRRSKVGSPALDLGAPAGGGGGGANVDME